MTQLLAQCVPESKVVQILVALSGFLTHLVVITLSEFCQPSVMLGVTRIIWVTGTTPLSVAQNPYNPKLQQFQSRVTVIEGRRAFLIIHEIVHRQVRSLCLVCRKV